jgi:hypothetical protein|uniref:Uncharacterized protein n=1 Tax=Picea glauca TaxID=3330 RepID=A0A117NHN8_PICGL|nr:hypothetical protein ABT39_MTgene4696 [Picea glauca]QHR90957.1 hypothetical protein Q903MT_gene4986 [Picea sitchensis]
MPKHGGLRYIFWVWHSSAESTSLTYYLGWPWPVSNSYALYALAFTDFLAQDNIYCFVKRLSLAYLMGGFFRT